MATQVREIVACVHRARLLIAALASIHKQAVPPIAIELIVHMCVLCRVTYRGTRSRCYINVGCVARKLSSA